MSRAASGFSFTITTSLGAAVARISAAARFASETAFIRDP
jgi:hypothetical protein